MSTTRQAAEMNPLVRRWWHSSDPGASATLTVSMEQRQATVILHLQGRLTAAEAEVFQRSFDPAWRADASRIVVDFSACSYLDSAGAALLVSALKEAEEAGKSLVLAGLGPQVRNVLALSRVDTLFDTRATFEDALGNS